MDEVIRILREQTVLCSQMPTLLNDLIKVMRENSPDVQEPIGKIENLMQELSASEKKTQEFLKGVEAANFKEYLSKQEKSVKRDVAEKLLKKSAEAQIQLQSQLMELRMLLKSGKDFADFNLNILTQTAASDTYGKKAQRDSRRKQRIFDANV